MHENKMNKFQEAIDKDELLDFAIGKDSYFIVDRDYSTHSVIQSWASGIIRLLKEKGEEYVNPYIVQMIHQILNSKNLNQDKFDVALTHLNAYYIYRAKGIVQGNLFQNSNKVKTAFTPYLQRLSDTDPESYKFTKITLDLIQKSGGLQNIPA